MRRKILIQIKSPIPTVIILIKMINFFLHERILELNLQSLLVPLLTHSLHFDIPAHTINPQLEVDLYYKSTLLEVGLYGHVLPLSIIKALVLGRL